jgi:hypothetical protein
LRTFAQEANQPQKHASWRVARSTLAARGPHSADLTLHLHCTIDNQAELPMFRTHAEEPHLGLTAASSPHFGHAFSQISVHPPVAWPIRSKLAIKTQRDEHEPEASRIADRVMRVPEVQLQRKCDCGNRTMAGRECEECSKQNRFGLQPKLSVNESGDIYEQEADLIADQVMSAPAHSTSNGAPFLIQRFSGQSNVQMDAGRARVHQALTSPGRPLEPALRKDMEQRFGYDFTGVQVHSGPAAERSAREINALAYTAGESIVFGTGRYAPGTSEGKRLLAHELTHVVQQGRGAGGFLQRAPGGATATPVRTLESLEVVAQRIAKLAIGEISAGRKSMMAEVNLEGGPGKVISVVRNMKTGEIYVGLNTGTPAKLTALIEDAIEAQKGRIAAGEVTVVHTASDAVGGHAEVNALNTAIAEQNKKLGYAMAEKEIGATFEMHNVWLSGGKRRLTTAPRCEHCASITRGVSVTSSQFKAEGGVSGEIDVPPKLKGGSTGGVGTGRGATPGGELPAPKPTVRPTTSVPEQVPETLPPIEVSRPPSIGKSAIKLAVTEIALNVLLFALSYYLEKRHAAKQLRKFNNDLKRILPDINAMVKNKEAEIIEKEHAFPLTYGNITVVYTHDKNDPDDYNEGSMKVQTVGISHQNYQIQEQLIKQYDIFEGNDPTYSLTFSVPLFEEQTAEKGASSLVSKYKQVRENLKDPAYKVRLQSAITLYKLVKRDQSLETLVVRDLLGLLKDEEAVVRLAAATFLSHLKAKIAIQYIRQVIPITSDDKQKELIQRNLRELEHG